jgi:hypothetical protein
MSQLWQAAKAFRSLVFHGCFVVPTKTALIQFGMFVLKQKMVRG